jgi:hypothetical protein
MTGTYLTFDIAREELKNEISLTNQEQVKWVSVHVDQSNRQVENDTIIGYENFPTDSTSSTFKSFADAALAWLVYQWFIKSGRNKDEISARYTAYQNFIAGLLSQARATPSTNRRPAVVVVSDPRSNKITLPTQANIFAFDDFA